MEKLEKDLSPDDFDGLEEERWGDAALAEFDDPDEAGWCISDLCGDDPDDRPRARLSFLVFCLRCVAGRDKIDWQKVTEAAEASFRSILGLDSGKPTLPGNQQEPSASEEGGSRD